MKFLYGVPDPSGKLEYGQCFVFLGDPAFGAIHRRFEDTEVVVGRNPMQHPGDVRKLTAVWVQELYNMKLVNVIVFPVKGNPKTGQLLNDEMSGGDFDGDQYIFIWNKGIVQYAENHDPYPYYLGGKPLTAQVPSVTGSSIGNVPTELIDALNADALDTSTAKSMVGSEISEQQILNILPSQLDDDFMPSHVHDSTFNSHSMASASTASLVSSLHQLSEPNQGLSLQQFPAASSDPSEWTSDEVKSHFNNKIGTSSEEAYEKLKLCAIGVLCHWDNSLGKTPSLFFSFEFY
jgi:RNA dependent RNA polymerase